MAKAAKNPKTSLRRIKTWLNIMVIFVPALLVQIVTIIGPGSIFWQLSTWRLSLVIWSVSLLLLSLGIMWLGWKMYKIPDHLPKQYRKITKFMTLGVILGGGYLFFISLESAWKVAPEIKNGPHYYSGSCDLRFSSSTDSSGTSGFRRRVEYDLLIDHQLLEIKKSDFEKLSGNYQPGLFDTYGTMPCLYKVSVTYIKVRDLALKVEIIPNTKASINPLYYK